MDRHPEAKPKDLAPARHGQVLRSAQDDSCFLVLQTSFLGDTVLTTPLIAELAKRGPVDVLVTPQSAPLLANNPDIREVVVYDKRGGDRGLRGLLRIAAGLRRARYDAAFLCQGSVRSGALTMASRIPQRIGFATSAGRQFYTDRVDSPEGEHHAARLLRLGKTITGVEPTRERLRPRLYPGSAERHAVDALLQGASAPLVALAPGSVWGTKRWPYYPALARELSSEGHIVVVGGAADAPLAREIADAAGPTVIDATGKLSLLASAELIGRAKVLVTNDSSPLHLASAMGTPTVAVFGPTIPEFGFGPLAPRAAVAGISGLACRPCDRHGPQRCPLGHWRCMREITTERVAMLVRDLLSTRDFVHAD